MLDSGIGFRCDDAALVCNIYLQASENGGQSSRFLKRKYIIMVIFLLHLLPWWRVLHASKALGSNDDYI